MRHFKFEQNSFRLLFYIFDDKKSTKTFSSDQLTKKTIDSITVSSSLHGTKRKCTGKIVGVIQ